MRSAPLLATLLLAAPAFAQTDPAPDPVPDAAPELGGETAPPKPFTLSAAVTGISDYRFRGVSRSGGDPAVQATATLNSARGFYLGAWSSTIDGGRLSRTPLLVGYGSEEVDVYGGFTKAFHGVSVDAGLLYYYFPARLKGVNTDFFEPYTNLSYTLGPVAAKLGANYAWGGQKALDVRPNNSNDNFYVYAEGSIGVPRTPLTLKGHVGRTQGSLGLANLNPNDDSYLDWSVTGEAVGGPVKVGVSYVDTSVTDQGGFARRFGRGSTVLGYVGLSF